MLIAPRLSGLRGRILGVLVVLCGAGAFQLVVSLPSHANTGPRSATVTRYKPPSYYKMPPTPKGCTYKMWVTIDGADGGARISRKHSPKATKAISFSSKLDNHRGHVPLTHTFKARKGYVLCPLVYMADGKVKVSCSPGGTDLPWDGFKLLAPAGFSCTFDNVSAKGYPYEFISARKQRKSRSAARTATARRALRG